MALLDMMLAFYSQFAAQNADNQSARLEAARAYRRVGAIHVRLGNQQNLEQAAKAYDSALELLATVEGRDLRRERATVLVELSQLQRLRRLPDESTAALQQALLLLEALPASGKGVRVERARVHYLLATQPPGRRPPGASRPSSAEVERDRARAHEEVKRAMDLLDGVLAEDAEHVEARALKARCLLAGRQARRRDERAAAQAEAIAILSDLVTKHPNRSTDRFELCRVLLEPIRDDSPGPLRDFVPLDVATCREAVRQADHLLGEQPQFSEYQRLRAQAGAELGYALVEQARAADPAARPALLAEAEKELHQALHSDAEPARGPRGRERQGPVLLRVRVALASAYDLAGSREDAIRELNALLDQVEPLLAERSNVGRFADLLGRPRVGEAPSREQLRGLVQRLGDQALQERLRALVQRLPPPPREEGPPAPEPRRNK
jgi:tetratricopeptide (TPR) repeat protein